MRAILCGAALAAALGGPPQETEPAGPTDAEAIERACLDYVEAFYLTKPELLERSVHPELAKIGFDDPTAEGTDALPMTRDEAIALAKQLEGYFAPDTPREIEILDRLDKTAAVRLTAAWGTDYVHLAKLEGRWTIVQVLWQAPTDPRPEEQRAAEAQAIERAVLDYVESAYLVKPEYVDRSVHRDLVKLGFTQRAGDAAWKRHDMDFDGLRSLVARWNADGSMPADAQKEVTVLGHLDRIAAAKVSAHWGVDYFQLVREGGRWKIRQVLWQSHPQAAGETDDAEAAASGG